MAKPKLALIPAAQGTSLYSVLPSSGVGDFDFTRSGSATRINSQGLIETVANGVSRLNYPMIDGVVKGCPHHILEPQRSNLITESEDFSQSAWVKLNSSIESDTLISPSGILNGSTLTDNTANTIHRLTYSVSLSASTDYGLSIFAKKGTLSNIQLALRNTTNSSTSSRVFDLENGILGESITSGTSGTLVDSKITDYGNGWYRCEIIGQLNSIPNVYQITLATKSSGNSTSVSQVTYDGDGNGNVYLWGAMLEQGSYPTSYIQTNGSAVTRVAETATGSGDAATFNDSEGVLMAEISTLQSSGEDIYISINNGVSDRITLRNTSALNNVVGQCVVGGVNQASMDYTLEDRTANNKVSIRYKLNDFSLWVNGFKVVTYNIGSVPTSLNDLSYTNGSGVANWYGNTKQLQYFDTALNDNELETLTSWVSFQEMAEGQLYTIE
jgi:hypothetical protein